MAWTINGNPTIIRSYMDFDFSNISNGDSIVRAYLLLKEAHNEYTPTEGHSRLSGSNASYIRRVTTEWNELAITWNNQPNTVELNKIIIPQDTVSNQDLTTEVTGLIKDMISIPGTSHGLMISLINETPYRSMFFASRNHVSESKRPKLIISY